MKRNVPFVEPHTSPFAFSTNTLIAPFPAVTTTATLVAFIFGLIFRLEGSWVLGEGKKNHLQNVAKIRNNIRNLPFLRKKSLGTDM